MTSSSHPNEDQGDDKANVRKRYLKFSDLGCPLLPNRRPSRPEQECDAHCRKRSFLGTSPEKGRKTKQNPRAPSERTEITFGHFALSCLCSVLGSAPLSSYALKVRAHSNEARTWEQ